MLRAAWWIYAALALWAAGAGARVYERCELARDLRGLGVRSEHVSTWVCIAFHESRFDTAARNPGSGDHGLLQISELYWCGGVKACGLPCEALRDDDISDDVECALRVYEEHTRLQGDGFLAWVVYPQHCKHNTKKYLVDCDETLKNASTTPVEKSRALDTRTKSSFKLTLNQSIDELLPPYISSTSNSGHNRNEIDVTDKDYQRKWQVTKFSNIDDLSLPVFGRKTNKMTESPTTPKLMSREENQLKATSKNVIINNSETNKPAGTTLPYHQNLGAITNSWKTQSPPKTTTAKPNQAFITTTSTTLSTSTTRSPNTMANLYHTTFSHELKTSTHSDKKSAKDRFQCLGCRTTSMGSTSAKSISSFRFTTTTKPSTTVIHSGIYNTFATSATTKHRPTTPVPSKRESAPDKSSIANRTVSALTGRSRTTSIYTTTPRSKYTTPNSATKISSKIPSTLTTTPKSITHRRLTATTSSSRNWRTLTRETAANSNRDTRASQRNAIFDLYLNTERPTLTTFKFTTPNERLYRRRIFADGTTSPATPWKRNGAQERRIK